MSDHAGSRTSWREVVVAIAGFSGYFALYFSPVTSAGGVLAPNDGFIFFAPALLSDAHWWNHNLYSGFPAFADPQMLVLSPLRLFGDNYNLAVISTYVIASSGTFVLVHGLTGSRLAGAFAGVVFGSGAPMVAHLAHLTVIYTVAWIPWMLAAVATARAHRGAATVVGGAMAMLLAALGCHPQFLVYGLLLSFAYALFQLAATGPEHRPELARHYAVMFFAGLCLASIQLVPLMELARWSVRARMSFEEFVSYSLSPSDLALFLFPNLFGSFREPYFGRWNLAELTTYAGISTLLLTVFALRARQGRREALFWVAVAIIGVLYALGPSTPLASVAYHVPVIGQFRAPARTAFTTTLALAVLAGLGIRALAQGEMRGRLGLAWTVIAAFSVAAIVACYALYPAVVARASSMGVSLPPWHGNDAVLVPLLLGAASMLCVWGLARRFSAAPIVLVLMLVIDLGSFGWIFEWRSTASARPQLLDRDWQAFAQEVRRDHTRVLFVEGNASTLAARPNLNLLYDLPSATAYNPLLPRAYAEVTGSSSGGEVASPSSLRTRLAITGTRWVAYDKSLVRPMHLGGDCTTAPGKLETSIELEAPVLATHVEVVSRMECSVAIGQDRPVVSISLNDGGVGDVPLRAGRDTAEWAIERPDVAAVIAHRAPASSEPYPWGSFNGHWFRSRVALSANNVPIDVRSLSLDWLQGPGPSIYVRSIELVNEASGEKTSLDTREFTDVRGVRATERRLIDANGALLKIPGIKSGAWIVGRTIPASDKEILHTIRTGRFSDGTRYDPYRMAFVPGDATLSTSTEAPGDTGKIDIVSASHGEFTLKTETLAPAFLVLAETHYPGWRAYVDGTETPIIATNLAFQGIELPPGQHTVIFSFFPRSLLVGLAVMLLGMFILIAYARALASRCKRGNHPNSGEQAPAPNLGGRHTDTRC